MKRSISCLLLLAMLLSLLTFSGPGEVYAANNQPASYSDTYNSGTRDVVCTTLSGTDADDYYVGTYSYDNLSAQSGNALLQSLRKLMTSTHKKVSSYNDCRDMAVNTDCQNEDGTVLLVYTSYVATRSQYNGWNREHVWPKSLGGDSTSGGGADLHHIRPSDASVNSSRGNKKYGNVDGGTAKYGNNPATGCLGGHYDKTYFEPLDNVKGDVARICLYVYVRWGSQWGADSITKVFQSVDVLLEWMELDPVDTWEMGRNEVVEAYQGNRNVFIDYPELAWQLFGEEAPANMTTPSRGSSGSSGGDSTSTTPTTPTKPACTHTNTELRGKKEATCTENGYSGDTYCTDCGVLVSSGANVTATGHVHTELRGKVDSTCTSTGYSGDEYCTDCDTKLSTGRITGKIAHSYTNGVCSVCNKADESATKPEEPSTKPEEPSTKPTEPSTNPTEPSKPGEEDSNATAFIIGGVLVAAAAAVVVIVSNKK